MERMFYRASQLTTIEGFENWNTSSVTDLNQMFSACSVLTELSGIENWDVSNVLNMSYLFYSSKAITTFNLSGWEFNPYVNVAGMFMNNTGGITIYVKDTWTEALIRNGISFPSTAKIVVGSPEP